MASSENPQALMRIATVLLALAEVAERAGARPRPVLWIVLCFLWPAEAIARRFVLDLAPAAALPALVFPCSPATNGRVEAFRLAAAFRLLAAVLGAVAAAGMARGSKPSLPPPSYRLVARSLAAPAPAAADTS